MKRLIALLLCLSLFGCADTLVNVGMTLHDIAQSLPDVPVQPPLPAPKPNPVPVVQPQPTPAPTPSPAPIVQPVQPPQPIPTGPLVVWDGEKIPAMMDAKGWPGNGTEQYYALFSTYGSHNWGYVDPGLTSMNLWNHRDEIRAWFTAYVAGIGNQLKANPSLKAILIQGDANDLGGLFMVDNIRSQLLQMGVNPSQIEDGQVYRP